MDNEISELVKKVVKQTKTRMRAVNTYRKEFDAVIDRYADLYVQYEILRSQWYDRGCVVSEEYTNKAGAVNQRKTPLYLSMETLRKELVDLENILGLTPKGLKQINSKGLETKKQSALEKALSELGG